MALNSTDELKRMKEKIGDSLPMHEEIFDRDLVILHSVISAAALDEVDTPSILILHGAMRELSSFFEETMEVTPPTGEYFAREEVEEMRKEVSDLLKKPDVVAANSKFVRQRTKEFYGVEPRVLYPPIDTGKFRPVESEGDYFLSVQRMVWYKRPEVQIEVFKQLDEKLVMVGDGRYSESIRRKVKDIENIDYKGRVEDEELVELYSGAKATVQTSMKEDFGYVPREGMACGTPAIAGDEGGFSELLEDGKIGESFDPRDRKSGLKKAVRRFDQSDYESEYLRKKAKERYSIESFLDRLEDIAEEAVK